MYETIKDQQITYLDRNQLNAWIETEVINLTNDFGQNMAPDLLVHTCKRLRDVLATKYKSWAVADVHAAFQLGMSGAYGVVHKVTVQRLFHWLKEATKLRVTHAVINSERQPRTAPDVLKVNGSDYGSFLCFLTKNKIWVADLVPGWDFSKKEVPPKLRDLSIEFAEAKEMDMLPAFRMRLRGGVED